jgi:hypothetical protein
MNKWIHVVDKIQPPDLKSPAENTNILSILESTAYEFGPGRGLITYTYPEDRRPEMKSDVIALGFITNKEDAVLLRIDSGTSNDYMELEIVSTLANKMSIHEIY